MAWKGLHLSRSSRLRLADGQMIIGQEDGEVRLPLEDTAYIVVDTPEVSLTSALISACMEAGIAILFTDHRHMPSGLTLPFHRHHRQAAIAALQLECSLPLKKRLWQAVIVAKIENQAAALKITSQNGAQAVAAMARQVGSGDPDNVEARAARQYWSQLFNDFVRDGPDDYRNKALNYGYAVLRAGIARALVASGFLPALGLHHASASNPFNLADDLIEPFRPFIDVLVWELAEKGTRREGDLSRADRQTLAGSPMGNAIVGGETVSILVAMEKAAESLVRAMEASTPAILFLPHLLRGPK